MFLAGCLWPGSAVAQDEWISEAAAVRVADRDSNAVKERRLNDGVAAVADKVDGKWEVAYFAAGRRWRW